MDRREFNIGIVGAGLVGLVLAILLDKAGYAVTIFDADAELKEIGAGIIIPINACRALAHAGVLELVLARAEKPEAWMSHSWRDGSLLSSLHLPTLERKYGAPFLVIHRADLRRILYEAARAAGIRMHLGVQVDPREIDVAAGTLNIGEGRQFHADFLIAADGQASRTRAWLQGQSACPRYTGKSVHRIQVSRAQMHELGLGELTEPAIRYWLGPSRLVVGYMLKDVYNVALTTEAPADSVAVGARPISAEEMRAAFGEGWDPRIRKLVECGHNFQKWQLLDYGHGEPAPWIHLHGLLPIALVGDSAHAIGPFLGSGAALGFESAAVLAGLLNRVQQPADLQRALQLYEDHRQPRTMRVRLMTEDMGNVWMLPDGREQEARDRRFRVQVDIGYSNVLEDLQLQQWLYGYDGTSVSDLLWGEFPRL